MKGCTQLAAAVAALMLLGLSSYAGLASAPPDADMGNVYRIMYVHVPSAWVAMAAFCVTFAASVVFLAKTTFAADALAEASAAIGVLFSTVLIVTGSLWGKPTWGTWWTWDPRLTTVAVMLMAFGGYLALRRLVDEPERRATWSAVTAVIISVDIPIVWFSVKWWNTLHQQQSTLHTVAPEIAGVLALNVVAFSLVALVLGRWRYAIARARQRQELAPPPVSSGI